MEYYNYKEIGTGYYHDGNSTSQDGEDDQMIVIAIASSLGGIIAFLLFCCFCSACCAGYVDNCINNSLSGSDEEYGARVLRRMEEEKERKKDKPEVRKEKLLNSFDRNKVTMVVTESSFVTALNGPNKDSDETLSDTDSSTDLSSSSEHSTNTDQESDEDVDPCDNYDANIVSVPPTVLDNDIESGEPKELYIPSSNGKSKQSNMRKVPNCCAICLCSYDVGDTIVWSSNKDCNHAFHDECIIPWLTKNQEGECPCCRSQFTDLPPPDGKKKKDSPSIWSIRSWFVRLRSYTFISQRE